MMLTARGPSSNRRTSVRKEAWSQKMRPPSAQENVRRIVSRPSRAERYRLLSESSAKARGSRQGTSHVFFRESQSKLFIPRERRLDDRRLARDSFRRCPRKRRNAKARGTPVGASKNHFVTRAREPLVCLAVQLDSDPVHHRAIDDLLSDPKSIVHGPADPLK